MHVYLWDATGSALYMRPLIEEFSYKGIPLTQAFGFLAHGWLDLQ